MALDLTGVTLAKLLVSELNLPAPPVNPTPAQEEAYQSAVAAQLSTWTIISSAILSYISQNANVVVNVPANGIEDGSHLPCTGSASGIGTLS